MEWGASEPVVQFGLLASHVAAAALAGWLAFYTARTHWSKLAGRLFVALVVSFAVWTLGSLARLYTLDPELYVAITAGKYLGVTSAPVWFFLFALVYAGGRHLVTRWRVAGLLVVPVVVVASVATTLEHGLYYSTIAPATVQGLTVLETTRGPAAWAFVVYGYGLLALGTLLLVYALRRRPAIYRVQSLLVVLGIAIPWAASLAYVVADLPHPAIDPTPVAFIAGSSLFAVGVFTTQLVDLVPAARSRVFEAIDDAVIVLDVEDRVVDANTRALELLHVESPIGESILDVVPPGLGKVAPPIDAEGEVRKLDVDGETRYYRRRDLPLGDRGETGTVVVLADVTARERARRQLQRRQRQLERQNEHLEEFASVVSHDLRNPLGVAVGNLELAREDCDSERLDEVERAHDRIEALVEDLLALARQGRAVGEPDTVAVGAIARSAWSDVSTGEATLEVADATGTVRADADRLRELFANLFRNAREHAAPALRHGGDGGDADATPPVTVRVGSSGRGFYVEDDGPGIPPDEREAVFEHGYSTSEDGTGLGLSIVRTIAEAHGWSVAVTDGADGGARFAFDTRQSTEAGPRSG